MEQLLRKILVIGIVSLLIGAIGLAFFKVNMVAYASGTIYIRANGLVEGTDKITNENNVTYMFTNDINDSIVVERSNVIIDGDEHTLNGSLSIMVGFNLTSVSNVTITNINIVTFGYAMWLEGATQCVISNNTCVDNEGGIWLVSSTGNTVSGNNVTGSVEAVALDSSSSNTIVSNNITDCTYSVYVIDNSTGNTISENNITTSSTSGIYLNGSPNNVISGNDIRDSPNEHICLLSASNNNIISGNTLTNSTADVGVYVYACSLNSFFGNNITGNADSGIRFDLSSDSSVSENNISENWNGVYLWYSSNIIVSGNNITANNAFGVFLDNSGNNIVKGNNITDNSLIAGGSGIALSLSSNNVLSGNNIISNNYWGINPGSSNNNTISGNNIIGNNVGINSASSNFNIVSANNIIGNVYSGIYLESSSNNTFHHNNLINNTNQVIVDEPGYPNNWDDGYPSGGNYWNDYGGTDQYEGISQDIPGNDAIGDTPYEINVDNVDRYPLMTPYEPLIPLFLESEGRWNMGIDTDMQVWSVFASDVDDDGAAEILTCGQVNESAELRIYSYDGLTITLEHTEMWNSTEGDTRAWSVFAADVDGDGVTEILTGAETYNGQNNVYYDGQLRIWNWNGTILTLEHSEEWHTGNNTHVYSVFAYDVDNDGEVEIMTGGDAYDAENNYICELCVWNWNGTVLTLEASEGWRTGGGEAVWSVYAVDVDGDGVVEILTSGEDNFNAQLRIWNWNGTTLTLEHSEEWALTWEARALSVFASDIDGDGNIEIVTGGEANALFGSSWENNGQLRVWNWNGSALTLKDSREWPLNGTYAYVWTICSGDVDRDGLAEIMTAGASGDGAQLRVWSFNDSTLTLDASQESVNEWADTVFASDVDDDGTTEIITAGFTFDATYCEQLKIWSLPESIPPTITIISPENKTYSTNTIPVTFAIDEPADWIGYSLNGQASTTITGNITLLTLPDGWYNVAVFANDTYGNMGMNIVYFTVDTANPNITSVSQDPLTNVLPDTVVKINATVTDATSGIKQVTLNYTTGEGTWISVEMTNLEEDIWNATIPALPYGTNVTYVIIAEDNAGNTITTEQIYGYKYEYPVVPEFPLLTVFFAFMLATLFLIIVFRKKRTLHTNKTQLPCFYLIEY